MAERPKIETTIEKPVEIPKPVTTPKPVETPKPFNTLVDLNAETIADGSYIFTIKDNNIAEVEEVEAVEMSDEEYELMFGAPMGNQNAVGPHDMGRGGSNTTTGSKAKKALWKTRNTRAFKALSWNKPAGSASGPQARAAQSGKNVYQLAARRAAVLGKGKSFTHNIRIAASEQTPADNVQLSRTDVLKLMHAEGKK